MEHRLTIKDQQELQATFPHLNCEVSNQKIWGTLCFSCHFDPSTQEIHHTNGPNFITDDYEIRIDFIQHDNFGLPSVYEESGIITQFAQQTNRLTSDVHIFSNGACCLGIDPTYRYTSATQFIYDKVVPFFYWQSYLRRFGREPWKCYSHNIEGIYEAITLKSNDFKKIKHRNSKCLCGSNKKYKYCCFNHDKILWHMLTLQITNAIKEELLITVQTLFLDLNNLLIRSKHLKKQNL